MTVELCGAIAKGNKTNPNLKGLRIENGSVIASDMILTMKVDQLPFPQVDCYVDAENFLAAYSGTKQPAITQKETLLTVQEGKFKADLMLLDKEMFQVNYADEDDSESVEPKDFLMAVKRVVPFLSLPNSQSYVINGYLYVTDGYFLIRTPIETAFPVSEKPLTISRPFAELILKVKKDVQDIKITDKHMTVLFEGAWIKSARFAHSLPADFEAFFANVTGVSLEPLPDDVVTSLKHVCANASDSEKFSFSPMGISLMQQGKVSWSISHPMPVFSIEAKFMKPLLDQGKEFNFDDPKRVVFRGDGIEGVCTTQV